MVALFCGSRNWADANMIGADLDALMGKAPDPLLIVTGGARGADTRAEREAHRRGIHVAVVKALWDRNGRRAGLERNAAMLLLRLDVVYAYDLGTRGTASMCDLASLYRVPLVRRYPREVAA